MIGGEWQAFVNLLDGAEYRFGVVTPESPVHRIEFAPGLTDAEVETVEGRFGFRFPPDLRAFLQTALPRGPQFPDWRSDDTTALREWLDIPRQGVVYDVEHNGFWLEEWGPRPETMGNVLALVTDLLGRAPRLIPIYSHRMMPDEPHAAGNPVFSVHQTDIIHYGFDLADCLRNPLVDIVDGWFFRVNEISPSHYVAEGVDLRGRSISRSGANPDALLAECARYAADVVRVTQAPEQDSLTPERSR